LEAIDVSGTIGLLRVRLVDPQGEVLAETCSGRIQQVLPGDGSYRVDISDCIAETTGVSGYYALTLNAISTTLGGEPNCGRPVACDPGVYAGSLQNPTQVVRSGAVAGHQFSLSAPGTVSITAIDPSGRGVLEVRLHGPDGRLIADACNRVIDASVGLGVHTILVNDCSGAGVQNYTLAFKVVSDSPDNCGVPLPCGATPVVHRLRVPGDVDAYTLAGRAGDRVTLTVSDVTASLGSVGLRIFDPAGSLLSPADTCVHGVRGAKLPKTGTYTALVSTCGSLRTGLYGIAFKGPACPAGPDITYFGIARADSAPLFPSTYDDAGRPVYSLQAASGFFVVIEARPGSSAAPVGREAFAYDADDASVLPDLQVLLSRPLGNASSVVCDKSRPHAGGVPRTFPLEFAETPQVAAAINDFGCRVDNGAGTPVGVNRQDACTEFNGDFHFVDPNSTLQFCATIDSAWSFGRGATVLKARVRDEQGWVGAEREMIVEVGPQGRCPGDCNGDLEVTVDEVILGLNIALGDAPVDACEAMDWNGDAAVTVDEVLMAVAAALRGCPGAESAAGVIERPSGQ
jgi:hypothetical protein